MEVSGGFFTLLFQQFVALLSVFCIAPTQSAPEYFAANLGPPGAEAASAYVAAPAQSEPLMARVVQVQIDGLLGRGGVGEALARTADGVTNSILKTPETLRVYLDNGGVAALPGGLANAATQGVQNLESNTYRLIDAIEALALANLQLLPGGTDMAEIAPTLAARDESFGALGRALLAAPTLVLGALQRGPEALPAALNSVGQSLIRGAATDARAVVRAVSSATQAVLALVPGAQLPRFDQVTVATVAEPVRRSGPVELIVRFPIAVGVAASDLARSGMTATTIMVTAVVTAVTDIADAARGQSSPSEELTALAAERPLTVPEAIAKAPVTIRTGAVKAGRELQGGVERARADFNETLQGPQLERSRIVTGDLGNTVVARTADDNTAPAKELAVKPNRPRPVLGAIKTVTGTLKAVRDGLRTALGLPPRKPRGEPAPEKVSEAAPAAS
ncbi:hypothetical protein DVS77_13355 [Mycolicibacterium moriokaense]|nr:hypothetical protein DVS77_13355 [Mycolicibacterium moriokaense]